MILTTQQSLILILVMAGVTFLTRLLPFILFPGHKTTPKFIDYLGRVLPFAIIGMLVVYCLKNVDMFEAPFGFAELISILFIVGIHLWKRNNLLSIGGGTLIYMTLVQFVFR